MNYRNNNYILAEKMKDRFGRRGSDVSGMQASTTSELMRRAEREHNPYGNASEQAFRENYMRHQNGGIPRSNVYRTADPAASEMPRQNRPQQAPRSRVKNAGVRDDGMSRQKQQTPKRKPAPEPSIVRPEPIVITPVVEERAEKKPFPLILLAILAAAALVFMGLVSSISEVYQTKREIANLEKQLAQLEETAEQLELRLEDKNDVKTIESMASERLGMVKEEYVQKEYISISDGERIELIDNGEEDTAGGIMLSSIFSALGDFFERFK